MIAAVEPDPCGSELHRILGQCLECASRLQEILQDEHAALEQQDTENLRTVITSKTLCVQLMESLEAERQAICAAAGYDSDESGMQGLFNWCDQSSTLAPLWQQLLQSSRACERLNRTNGAIGRVRYKHVLGALAVLSGNGNEASLYNPEGRESAGFKQRALALI